jgi:hypothetical protein
MFITSTALDGGWLLVSLGTGYEQCGESKKSLTPARNQIQILWPPLLFYNQSGMYINGLLAKLKGNTIYNYN